MILYRLSMYELKLKSLNPKKKATRRTRVTIKRHMYMYLEFK